MYEHDDDDNDDENYGEDNVDDNNYVGDNESDYDKNNKEVDKNNEEEPTRSRCQQQMTYLLAVIQWVKMNARS
jgi:hypothetical protein